MDRSDSRYLPALDGLRAISVLLVVISHAWLGYIVPGGLGVTIFFFISGFIITRLMLAEYKAANGIDVKAFYVRRFFRLAPALFVYILISVFCILMLGGRVAWQELLSVFFYYANYYGIFIGFHGAGFPSPFSIIWSLSVEEHYYFVFPFLFLVLAPRRRSFLMAMIAFMLGCLLWRWYLAVGVGLENMPETRIYKATDTRFDSIIYGATLSLILFHWPKLGRLLSQPVAFIAGIGLLLLSLAYRDPVFRETLRYSLQGMACLLFLGYAVFNAGPVRSVLSSRWFVYFGKISYSMYLYHWLVFGLVTYFISGQPLWLRIGAMLFFSWMFAHLSYTYVEKIGLELRHRMVGVKAARVNV